MKKYLPVIILVVLAVAAIIVTKQKGKTSTLDQESTDFSIQDTSTVTKIVIKKKNGDAASLTRGEGSVWMVNEKYPARKDAVELLLTTFKRIDVKSPVGKAAKQNVIKHMAASGTRVDIYTRGGKPTKTYHVGSASQDQTGTYMVLEENDKMSEDAYIMHIPGFNGFLTTRFFVEEHKWRDRLVFDYTPQQIKKLTFENYEKPKQSFSIEKQPGGNFVLFDGSGNQTATNSQIIKDYLTRYKKIYWEVMDVETPKEEKDSILSSDGFYKITVQPIGSNPVKIHTYRLENKAGKLNLEGDPYPYDLDRMHAVLNGQDFVYIQYATFDKLYRELDQFTEKGKKSTPES